MEIEEATVEPCEPKAVRRRLRSDRGAIGTEMAIVVAVVIGISLALAGIMRNSAQSHQACIPQVAGTPPPANCP